MAAGTRVQQPGADNTSSDDATVVIGGTASADDTTVVIASKELQRSRPPIGSDDATFVLGQSPGVGLGADATIRSKSELMPRAATKAASLSVDDSTLSHRSGEAKSV